MSLSTLSVRRGVTFGMLFLLIFLFGVYSLSRLQLDLYPEMTFPAVLIMTNYTGASPEDVENLVTRPIEEGVATVKGIEKISSQSKQGASIVTVEFGWDKDMDQAETDVRRKMDMVTQLPDDATVPIIVAMDPAMQPVVMLTVNGEYSLVKLKELAENNVCERIERLDGVAACDAMGGMDREIRVSLRPDSLAAYGVDVQTIMTAIGMGNIQEPGGAIDQGTRSFNIQTTGKYQSVEEVKNVVIAQRMTQAGKSSPLYLHQVADVMDMFSEETQTIEVDGRPSVWIIVRKQSGFNTVKAADATMAEIARIRVERGDSLSFGVLFNQADFINASIGNLSTTAFMAIGISFLVLLFFLRNLRSALIVSTAIPLSVVATFAVMNQMKMTLNVISMAGLALSVGMLVDNAIVVLDNVFRHRQQGMPIREAAVQGAREVSMAVTASTLTTVAVFLPILFVPGIAGVIFKDMAVTICFALSVSLIVAISFIPLAASRLLAFKKKNGKSERKDATRRIEGPYGRFLAHALSRRWIVMLGLGALIGTTAMVATTMPTDFMARNDHSMVFAKIKAPVGSNLEETTRYTHEAVAAVEEAIVLKDRKLIAAEIGTGDGFTALFSEGVHSATLRIPLSSVSARDTSQAEYEARLREQLSEIPDLEFSVEQPNPTGGSGDMEINIRGHDLDELRRVGRELTDMLAALPEMAQVDFSFSDPTPQVNVVFERDKMARMGISTAAVGSAVATFFLGKTAAFFSDGDNEYKIYVRFEKRYRQDVRELERMPVPTPAGKTVPLWNIASITFGPGPVTISRKNQQRMVTIACSLKDTYIGKDGKPHGKDLGASIARVQKRLNAYNWPDEMGFEVGGTAEDFIESFIALGFALMVSVLLVYMVMASQFESFREPFIILFTVPLALIGVVLIFSITGNNLDVSALIGVIMLVGIVVNNGIVMVDAANQRRNDGLDRKAAVVSAAQTRLRPVLMTSFTTICSMIPLAMGIGEGSESWKGMAQSVVGGMSTATLLTLVVVPTFYTFFARKKAKASAR
ncbi:MAG: efflux RND transporter permease subunit [Deltaproteobacteria bacterium]|nr:efflux RND transporter permease subunit [Deltaproteobacteria bacterium]